MDEQSSESGRWLTKEDYVRHREVLQKAEDTASDEFDKVMIALSGGALAISLTFIKQIAPEPKHFWLCITSWALFALAMTCTLISFRTTQEAMRRQADILEEVFSRGGDFGFNRWDAMTRWLNSISLGLFVAGVASLIIFVSLQQWSST